MPKSHNPVVSKRSNADDRASGVRQCKLRRGNVEKVVWIPERFAKRGNWLKLFDEDGWRVISTGMWLPGIAQHHGYFAGGIFHA